ncbi:MAG TPA: hypothetical protein VN616_08285, partial [Puia sp.]|nr:hypothetical protein [Puia sp.]
GASRAWLTSVVFAIETTGQLNGLLPLLGACLAAYFVSFFLMKGTIMTEKIHRRGVRTPDAFEPDTLQTVSVRELMTPAEGEVVSSPAVFASDDAGLAAELMGEYDRAQIAVKEDREDGAEEDDTKDKVIGVITAQAILHFYSHQRQKNQGYQSPTRTRRILAQGRKILRTHKN